MQYNRLTLFAGHYGSGKTNIAVNYALWLKGQGEQVLVADLDIVNPYFRTKDSQDLLQSAGIDLISSPYANSNVDLPAIPGEIYAVIDQKSHHAVLDIGGDDRGAMALGRYRDGILAENDYEMLLVINKYRPLAAEIPQALEILAEIQAAAGIPITALVNNSNLGVETTPELVKCGMDYAQSLAKAANLPIKMTTATPEICQQLQGEIPELFPINLQKRDFF